jgi:putative nucleotidyltransferase with HDIG domain
MITIYQFIRANQSKIFLYGKAAGAGLLILFILTYSDSRDALPYRFTLMVMVWSVFTMLLWAALFINSIFHRTMARIITFTDIILIFAVMFPIFYSNSLYLLLPLITLMSMLFLFSDHDLYVSLLLFYISFTVTTVVYGVLGVFGQPLLTYVSQAALFLVITASTLMMQRTIKELEFKQERFEEEKHTIELKNKNLQRELQVSRQQSDLLHKDMRKKDIEIKNIISLSGQLSIREDARKALTSFLLTAIGQIGSSHAAIFTRRQLENNFIELFIEKGLRGYDQSRMRIYLDSSLAQMLSAIRDPILVNQVPRDGLYNDEIRLLEDFSQDLICPFYIQDHIAGILIIGRKVSGVSFSPEDINLISVIALQTSFILEQTQLTQQYREFYSKTLRAMIHSIEARYIYSRGHNVRTAKYVNMVSQKMGLSSREISDLSYGALLHDIGKIAVEDKYLLNQNLLSASDPRLKDKILEHTLEGSRILKAAGFNDVIIDMALHHHEFFDGRGFPDKIGSNELSVASRILSVCNAYDAMISDRPYRKALAPKSALENLKVQAGRQFDPEIVQIFLSEFAHKNRVQQYN